MNAAGAGVSRGRRWTGERCLLPRPLVDQKESCLLSAPRFRGVRNPYLEFRLSTRELARRTLHAGAAAGTRCSRHGQLGMKSFGAGGRSPPEAGGEQQGWEVPGQGVSAAGRRRNGNEEVPVEEETSRMGLGEGWDWKRVVGQNGKRRGQERACGAGL